MTVGGYQDAVVTGEAVALDVRTAGIGSRGVAMLIDVVAQTALAVVLLLVAGQLASGAEAAAAAAISVVLLVAVLLGYPVAFETLLRGRTPGKAAMGLRVVRDDGGPIRFRHALVRGLVGVVLDKPGVSGGVLALLPMLLSQRSKRLGDMAAGTVVVQERVPARVLPPPPMPPYLAGWAARLDLTRLDDELALAIRSYLGRAAQLAPWARAEMEGRLLHDVSARVAPVPPGVPPWDYLLAVLAERRQRQLDRLQPPPPPPPAASRAVEPPPEPPAGAFRPPG